MRYLTEAEAWREIAKREASLPAVEYGFLCWLVEDLFTADLIDSLTADAMLARARAHVRATARHRSHAAWNAGTPDDWPSAPTNADWDRLRKWQRDCRVLAALFLAHEAEDEAAAQERAA